MLIGIFAAGTLWAGTRGYPEVGIVDFVPQPVLLSPASDGVDLAGKDSLEFKWSPHEGDSVRRDYYDFRLYKGYNFLESALLLKQKVPSDIYVVRLRADMFEDGQVYTWSLRQVYTDSNKSHRSFQSFRVTNGVKTKSN